VSPSAQIQHDSLRLGQHSFVGDLVVIFQSSIGEVAIGDRVHLYRDIIIETGESGCVEIGDDTHIQPGCRLMGYKRAIRIGKRVEIAPNCACYPYNHGVAGGATIRDQRLESAGDIVIGDDAWLGFGVTVLDGVRIGCGAVIGAGAVVTRDIPDEAIAVGCPARVVGSRNKSLDVATELELPAIISLGQNTFAVSANGCE
jgi:acetyltransferase-like isoleucine patch superfamily enzyme